MAAKARESVEPDLARRRTKRSFQASRGIRELDWLVRLRARGTFGADRHGCVVRRPGSGGSHNGRGRLDPRGVAAGWGRCHGNRHLVDALPRNAGVRPPDPRRLSLADRSAVTACGHPRVGHCTARREPAVTAERSASDKRSEEHTSELQSLAYLVCRLLLEKKKTKECRVS